MLIWTLLHVLVYYQTAEAVNNKRVSLFAGLK